MSQPQPLSGPGDPLQGPARRRAAVAAPGPGTAAGCHCHAAALPVAQPGSGRARSPPPPQRHSVTVGLPGMTQRHRAFSISCCLSLRTRPAVIPLSGFSNPPRLKFAQTGPTGRPAVGPGAHELGAEFVCASSESASWRGRRPAPRIDHRIGAAADECARAAAMGLVRCACSPERIF